MKQIALSQGKFAIVDDEDYEFLSQWKWHLVNKQYAARTEHSLKVDGSKTRRLVLMHREILKADKGKPVDHADRNGLNNTRANLRLCTQQENLFNRRPMGKTSKYKGVSFNKKRKKWRVSICHNNVKMEFGHFEQEEDAAIMYNFVALEKFGEFAFINNIQRS